ncbi:von Willebrand factor A domain-containing protein 3A [Lamellibrachia satsuma]|nr:von Willebrand factor A domain-containing protein 3A [Lamellibrachia satsuma]
MASQRRYNAGRHRGADRYEAIDESTRKQSLGRMKASYNRMMNMYASQQSSLSNRPKWVSVRNESAMAPDPLTVTNVSQLKTLQVGNTLTVTNVSQLNTLQVGNTLTVTNVSQLKTLQVGNTLTVTNVGQLKTLQDAGEIEATHSETQTSDEWLKTHSVDTLQLNLKNLMDKSQAVRPSTNPATGKLQQHIQFEAVDINDFEYRLNKAIEMYTKRIKWLLQGSRRVFGLIKRSRVGVLIDTSDANCGFGRLTHFQDSLMHLIDEQMAVMKSMYLVSFGSSLSPLWANSMDINCRTLAQAKDWVTQLQAEGGCNLLKALEHMYKRKDIDNVVVILGCVPDQTCQFLCDYVAQLGVGRDLPIHTVAYDCCNHHTHVTLRTLAEQSGGRYQCYDSASEEQIYGSSDIGLLLREVQKAQRIINKIIGMRQGLLGTALVSVTNEINNEVAKLPQSRFLPRPPGHDLPLKINMPTYYPTSSGNWLAKHGLKAKGLDLYQVLSPNAYSYKEEFIPVIRKTVQSQVNEKAMAQFKWHDGSMRNIHVDMSQLFEYQKQLGATVKLYEQRLDWLSSGSRKIFGSVKERSVLILVDVSVSNLSYLIHIQHSLRLLLEQQIANKEYFNIIAFSGSVKSWKPTLVRPTPENLQEAWRWLLALHCEGSRNFLTSLRAAIENEEELNHGIDVEGVYLFTSGVPDQPMDLCVSYMEEQCAGSNQRLHVILFNVDDYDVHGAIPSRYANITKTAESLRSLAHCTGGRFHWFRETGIIESDDIALLSQEVDKAINFSKKCAMLVDSVKKKYNLDTQLMDRLYPGTKIQNALPQGTTLKALQPPKHTALSQTRMQLAERKEKDGESVMRPASFRPSSAIRREEDDGTGVLRRPQSAKDPMQRVRRPKKEFFYTEQKNGVGAVYKKFPTQKLTRKGIRFATIQEKEDQITSKEWLRMYSLAKLKLDLNKLVSGPDCRHIGQAVKTLHKVVDARSCNVFPTINVAGTLKHLQLLPHELTDYEDQITRILRRYLKRLQWLLSGSKKTFGAVVERKCVFLIDTSGSMDPFLEDFKKELASLVWDQLYKYSISFNLVHFSKNCEQWRPNLAEPTEENCHDAVRWISTLVANGNTCTLQALELAFKDPAVDAIYLLTDGKPDTSTSLVLSEVVSMNTDRHVVVNTISFNCDDSTANNFLVTLAHENGGRFHRCHANFDAQLFAHTLLTEGFTDHEYPHLPEFQGDDLKRLSEEIATARRFISQSRSYRALYEELKKSSDKSSSTTAMVGPCSRARPISAK